MKDSRLSIQEYCLVAAMMPKEMPMIDASQVAGQRQKQCSRQTLGDHVGHRPVVEEAAAEITLGHHSDHPVDVLDGDRLVEAVGSRVGAWHGHRLPRRMRHRLISCERMKSL